MIWELKLIEFSNLLSEIKRNRLKKKTYLCLVKKETICSISVVENESLDIETKEIQEQQEVEIFWWDELQLVIKNAQFP